MASVEQVLEDIQHAVNEVCSFLLPYLPLANAHNTDFIIDQKWSTYLPLEIAEELESLDDQSLVYLPSAEVSCLGEILDRKKNNDHEIRTEARRETLLSCEFDTESGRKPKWNKLLRPAWQHECLKDFLASAKQCTLPMLGVLTDLDKLQTKWKTADDKRVFVDKFMSIKKCHEIDLMTELCHLMAQSLGINSVIDIGSGRGYLGCHLALMYGYQVLGIDSSDGNTHSAAKRTKQLQKQWGGLVKNASRKSGTDQKECDKDLTTKSPASSSMKFDSKADCDMSHCDTIGNGASSNPQTFVPITQFVTAETNLRKLLIDHFPPVQDDHTQDNDNSLHCDPKISESVHQPRNNSTVTGQPCDGSCFGDSAHSDSFLMTGLHTCGNLAPSLLRLFVSNPDAQGICNVGCCYNHIDEAFLRNPFLAEGDADPDIEGFPISDYLKSRQCQLGRNARMLAVQAPERIASEQKSPSKSIFWRALLQVILRDISGEVKDDWNVGKIGSKCSNFLEYVRKGLKKLKIDNELTDAEILGYEQRYRDEEKKMNLFFQLRASLSPCVESLILLDRLLYLIEQPCVREAYLLQLFNPVTSPRCYAIVATK